MRRRRETHSGLSPSRLSTVAVFALACSTPSLFGQYPPGQHHSPNVRLLSHVPLAAPELVADIEIEQELSRPYAYLSRERVAPSGRREDGFQIVSVKDPARAFLLYTWFIENAALHTGGGGGKNGKYFKLKGRYYYAQAFQFGRDGADADLSIVLFDVTGLPDTSQVRESARIRVPQAPGGAHNLFAYKHSNGGTLLFVTVEAPFNYPYGAHVYDMERLLAGDANFGFVGGVPLPEPRGAARGYHDAYVAYHPDSKQDRFYGGGPETTFQGGNFVYDVTDVKNPKLLATVVAQASMQSGGHTFVATPDGRYGLTIMTSPAHQPVRLWDLKPALDGATPVIRQPIGEWTVAPTKSGHMIEVRWPYAFIADYQQGLRVLDIRMPHDPIEVGFYDTYNYRMPYEPGGVASGAYGLDVRDADGLIVIADDASGFWAFKMDGFDGWNGRDWGMPNVSSAQDWDHGPEGAPKPQRVS
ncbi:MAG: hypothetical protein HY560_11295 [Gemmatimonadetes bacterium]|nr:hypothetical protein [Gemmatimonadota bacterium]